MTLTKTQARSITRASGTAAGAIAILEDILAGEFDPR